MLKKWTQDKNISSDVVELLSLSEKDGVIFFPVYDRNNKKKFTKYRNIQNNEPIKNPRGGSTSIYGLNLLKDSTERVYVTEGESDMLALNSFFKAKNALNKYIAVTSTSGVMSFKREWLDDELKDLEVVFVFDNDEAGHKGMRKVWNYSHEMYDNVKFLFIETTNDVSELCADYQQLQKEFKNSFIPQSGYTTSKGIEFTISQVPANDVPKWDTPLPSNVNDRLERARNVPFTDLHRFNQSKKGFCPFHNDKSPSLHLWDNNRVSCFVCDLHLDTIGFIQEKEKCNFYRALDILVGEEIKIVKKTVLL